MCLRSQVFWNYSASNTCSKLTAVCKQNVERDLILILVETILDLVFRFGAFCVTKLNTAH